VAGICLVLLVVTACASEESGEPPEPSAQVAPAPQGGTPDRPAQLEPTTDLLEWTAVPGAVDDETISNGTWFLTVEASGETYRLDGPSQSFGSGSNDGTRITAALLDADWAVVVREARAGRPPATAQVTDLASGDQFTINEVSDVPTTSGGAWALGGGLLAYPTVATDGAHCLANADLATRESSVGWCAAPKHDFDATHVTEAGTTVGYFDDATPPCRTVAAVDGGELVPFPGVPECIAWDGAMLTEDAAVWSVIPQEDKPEAAELFARSGDEYFALGPGTTGTLVPCADAAYFVREPRAGDPAQLLRWDGRALAVVYEARGGHSSLEGPRCGVEAIVVTARSDDGAEQVMASLTP
jgi:hypothetical protein